MPAQAALSPATSGNFRQLLHGKTALCPYLSDSMQARSGTSLATIAKQKAARPCMRTMYAMTRFRRSLRSLCLFGMLCIALTLNQGCARSEPSNPTDASSPAGEQKAPFRPDADSASASDGMHPAVSPDSKPAISLPFRALSHPRILPSGTLLTVQLEDSLSADKVRAGDAFAASLAAPLIIDGDTLIERGTTVTGRVESAQSQDDLPGLIPGSGYFRLTLSAITVEGKQLPVQTSSLFARGSAQPLKVSPVSASASQPDPRLRSLQVEKGHRLTFRLTAPVTLDAPNSVANRQSAGPIPE